VEVRIAKEKRTTFQYDNLIYQQSWQKSSSSLLVNVLSDSSYKNWNRKKWISRI